MHSVAIKKLVIVMVSSEMTMLMAACAQPANLEKCNGGLRFRLCAPVSETEVLDNGSAGGIFLDIITPGKEDIRY